MLPEKIDRWDAHIERKMFDKGETFEEKQFQERKSQIDVKEAPKRQPCAAELQTGYTTTPYQEQTVQYGRLGTIHVTAMMTELNARNIAYPVEKCGIRVLTKLLQAHLKGRWTAQNPGVAESVYDKNPELTKYFHPKTGRECFPYDEGKQKKR
jgi:hypothetical protein